jgi:hypothetical protein
VEAPVVASALQQLLRLDCSRCVPRSGCSSSTADCFRLNAQGGAMTGIHVIPWHRRVDDQGI